MAVWSLKHSTFSDDIIQLQEQLEYSRYFTKSLFDSLHEMAASASL